MRRTERSPKREEGMERTKTKRRRKMKTNRWPARPGKSEGSRGGSGACKGGARAPFRGFFCGVCVPGGGRGPSNKGAAALARAAAAAAACGLLALLAPLAPLAHSQTAPFLSDGIKDIPLSSLMQEEPLKRSRGFFPQSLQRHTPFVSDWRRVSNGDSPENGQGLAPDFYAVSKEALQSIAQDSPWSWIGETSGRLQAQENGQVQEQAFAGTDWLTSLIVREPLYNPEIQQAVQILVNAIEQDDLSLYQSLLRYMLENHSLAQILAVQRAQTKKGTILHLMAQSRSRNTAYELQALVSAFLPVTEEPQTSLLSEMRKFIVADKELFHFQRTDLWDQDLKEALQKNGGAVSLKSSPAADALLKRDAKAFHEALKQEMTAPGNSSLARALLLGRTEERISPLDHRLIQNFPDEIKAAFEKEIAIVNRWLALPLRQKNPKGLTPLELAEKAFRESGGPHRGGPNLAGSRLGGSNLGGSARLSKASGGSAGDSPLDSGFASDSFARAVAADGFIALARAEQAFRTDIDSPAYQNRPARYGKTALTVAAAAGAAAGAALTAGACFLSFAD